MRKIIVATLMIFSIAISGCGKKEIVDSPAGSTASQSTDSVTQTTENKPASEQELRCEAYYNKIMEYQTANPCEINVGGMYFPKGLVTAKLLDMSGDGNDQLLLIYTKESGYETTYYYEIWDYKNNNLAKIYSNKIPEQDYFIEFYINKAGNKTNIIELVGDITIISEDWYMGDFGNETGELAVNSLEYDGNNCSSHELMTMSSCANYGDPTFTCSVNGSNCSEDDFWSAYSKVIDNSETYVVCAYDQAGCYYNWPFLSVKCAKTKYATIDKLADKLGKNIDIVNWANRYKQEINNIDSQFGTNIKGFDCMRMNNNDIPVVCCIYDDEYSTNQKSILICNKYGDVYRMDCFGANNLKISDKGTIGLVSEYDSRYIFEIDNSVLYLKGALEEDVPYWLGDKKDVNNLGEYGVSKADYSLQESKYIDSMIDFGINKYTDLSEVINQF